MEHFLCPNSEIYNAFGYYRLSREDGDKAESDSIKNQRDLVHSYVEKHPDLRLSMERDDDGYTGTNFDRPAFQAMLEAIREKKVNCVIVKDLSRFGRDYIEAGRYIQRFFPVWGIRFIAINDNYDSLTADASARFVIPVKNLINDSYCRDTSIKVRSIFAVKRKNGEFVGSFASYGYMKLPENKNKLVIDEDAAAVVREIFELFLNGTSTRGIAEHLNEMGVLSPMEYKRAKGMKYDSGYKVNRKAEWSTVGVRRILTNAVYIGVMEQGKRTTPNYKVRNVIYRPETEWDRVENTHEAIIPPLEFELANRLLKLDTRVVRSNNAVHLLSGLVYCGGCGETMLRQEVTNNGQKYVYFICSAHNTDRTQCSAHRVNAEKLTRAVVDGLNLHITEVVELNELLKEIAAGPRHNIKAERVDKQIAGMKAELLKKQQLSDALYRRYAGGEVTDEDFLVFKKIFSNDCMELEEAILKRNAQLEEMLRDGVADSPWLLAFMESGEIHELTRIMAVKLVEKVIVHDKDKIEVKFCFDEEFAMAKEYAALYENPGAARRAM